ncbi:MAG: phasin family protein [Betaproteobacteria bacterium]|nr:phasin family protein [Betaproteobacteria bacterium]
MSKLPPGASQQFEAANQITNSALKHAKAAVQVQMETTQAMLDDHMRLAQSLASEMQTGNMQGVAQALAEAAQHNVQRYMAQMQKLAELSRASQQQTVEAVMGQMGGSNGFQQDLARQFGMNGEQPNMMGMMQNFLKIAQSSAEQFGQAVNSATNNAADAISQGYARPAKPKASARKR